MCLCVCVLSSQVSKRNELLLSYVFISFVMSQIAKLCNDLLQNGDYVIQRSIKCSTVGGTYGGGAGIIAKTYHTNMF